ncbi:MAG: tetratricopeptide repeat protein [Ktedonobacteraceae bacterium]|jgi:tetratricopeptide (TPR) repeat protein
MTETARGNYDQAESYFNDSIAIARQTGNAWHLDNALSGLGELYLKQQKLAAAAAPFCEMRDRRVKSNQKMLAIALYGLARIAFAEGKIAEARQQGQESLAILESMNDQRVPEVRQWLHTLD